MKTNIMPKLQKKLKVRIKFTKFQMQSLYSFLHCPQLQGFVMNKSRPRWGKPQTNHFHGRNRENYKKLPFPKVPDPDGFIMVLHQIIKHQIIPKLLKLFKSIEKEGKYLSSFSEVNIIQIGKPYKTVQRRKSKINITNEYQC